MNLWSRLQTRKHLVKAFKSAGVFLAWQTSQGEKRVYPKIHAIRGDGQSTEIVFTLPNGVDPALLRKNYFVFEQYFGRTIELEGEIKKFVLTVHNRAMPDELIYNAKEISEAIAEHRLGIICGQDRHGRYVSFDLRKQPHILIAGETGSGKSTQLRSILTTLIREKRPDELELHLGDCKKSEFHIFRNVEHVRCVLSSARDIERMLKHIKRELDERSDLTDVFEVSHIDELPPKQRRPYIVVCIDEFVMLRKNEEIMSILTEIVAIGRTLGVFAILSMQRPNAQVLDTTVRANLTVSMGFKLRDKTEARIVNTPRAEQIEISGRFIMNSDKVRELQAPYMTMAHAKELLAPYMVAKGPVKEVTPQPEILTEKDVFADVD
ncbi:FtsK/SpoIIIE domain-containing protein [Bacillus sp. JJ722]|uniref:FtsK/SpoIIIE domain-containing protein n=1 Tax=Bacillus sp. JJ722 TaxID=3122973 RepID=UPI002FFE256E